MMFTDGGGLTTRASFCTDFTKAYCDREIACNFLDQVLYADCVARVTTVCTAALSRSVSGVRTYEPQIGFACIGTVKADACAAGPNFVEPTGSTYSYLCLTNLGSAAALPGATCLGFGDCVTDAGFCAPSVGGNCRTCKAYVPQGMPCDFSTNLCNTINSFNYCKTQGDGGRECQPYASAGASCAASTICHPTATAGCSPGLSDGGTGDGGTRKCLALYPDGTECDDNGLCATQYCNYNSKLGDAGADVCGYRSVGQSCGFVQDCNKQNFCKGLVAGSGPFVAGVCTPRIASGGACVVEAQDLTDGCQVGELCFGGTCRAPGMQMLNQPCTVSSHCIPTLYCEPTADGGSGMCTARATVGQACSTAASGPNPICVSGTTCPVIVDAGTSVCTAPAPLNSIGGTCNSTANCKDLLQCVRGSDGGTCGPLSMAGSNCDAGTTICANGNTSLGFCAVIDAGTGVSLRTCSNLIGSAGTCTTASQCSSGRCLSTDGGTGSTVNPGTCAMSCLP